MERVTKVHSLRLFGAAEDRWTTIAVRFLVPRLTPRMNRQLLDELPTIDTLLRLNQIDEASVRVDRIVFGKNLSVAEIENVRSVLSALRSRRLMRGKTAKAN